MYALTTTYRQDTRCMHVGIVIICVMNLIEKSWYQQLHRFVAEMLYWFHVVEKNLPAQSLTSSLKEAGAVMSTGNTIMSMAVTRSTSLHLMVSSGQNFCQRQQRSSYRYTCLLHTVYNITFKPISYYFTQTFIFILRAFSKIPMRT